MEFVHMPSTIWTQISLARRKGGMALEDLLRKYRPPVLAFVRNMGLDVQDAEDLTQEIFLRVVEEKVVEKANKETGKFRSLLLAVTRHTVLRWKRDSHRLKRGGGRAKIALGQDSDSPGLEDLFAAPAEEEPAFDGVWVQNLVRLAMERLKVECEKSGTPYYRALMMYTDQGRAYADISQELQVSIQDVKNYLHQARIRLKKQVANEIQEYSNSSAEFEAEAEYLAKYLK